MAIEGQTDTQPTTATTSEPTSTAQPQTSQPSTPGSTTQAPSQPAAKWEDDPRAKGMLADLQKERKARQEFERKVAEHQTQLTERQRQIEALTGTKTPSKEEAELAAIQARLQEISPAAKLTQEQIDKFQSAIEKMERLEAAEANQWQRSNRQMIEGIYGAIAKETGDLSDGQKKRIDALYVYEAQTNPEFLKRHEAGDPTLAKEFVASYLSDMVEPIRRKVTAHEVSRQRLVPNGKDRSISVPGEKPIDVTDDKAVAEYLASSRKGKFGR